MVADRPGRRPAARRALLVGATGLTGSKLLALLLRSPDCSVVHVLARRPLALRHPKLRVHEVDFASLRAEDLPEVDDVHCCLGTTIRAAGSRAAFREVDHDHVVRVARLARERGATRLAVISAMGADPRSLVFYSRVKGEMEASVSALGYESVTLLRPSLLAGERAERRPGERLGLIAARALAPLIPLRYRAISADAVAAAMRHFAAEGEPGVQVVESGRLQAFERGSGPS
ncbi:MAG TPA: NAD(P)H-binding protein [Quisquiliibacterium sp.]|nr:NAD(P)H-binding protein [Quisquiliibacterium sp.]